MVSTSSSLHSEHLLQAQATPPITFLGKPDAMKAGMRAIQDPKGESRGRCGVAIDLPTKPHGHHPVINGGVFVGGTQDVLFSLSQQSKPRYGVLTSSSALIQKDLQTAPGVWSAR
ncbi:hypothetical protein WH7805_13163 [Synechococcus sp. WH 7805]|nr:hypothetical protein WH7805_13163 [Synechococcus sp. WH 7805]